MMRGSGTQQSCASECAIDHKKLALMKVTFERESLGSSRVNLFLL